MLIFKYYELTPTGKFKAEISGIKDKWSLVDFNEDVKMYALES